LVQTRHILLADDDKDDSLIFQQILEELPISTHLANVYDGEQLLKLLNDVKEPLPDILFLDLNMPRKNGLECLSAIKQNEKLKGLPVIIFSTSYEPEIVNRLYKNGAQYYIRKPNDFAQFKKVIYQALTLTEETVISQPPREKFVLSEQSIKQ
jgi:CheY-like chemotaxis protein